MSPQKESSGTSQPLHEPSQGGTRPSAATSGERPIRVLHVDDNPRFAEMAATFLERTTDDVTVVTETSASDGLERLEAGEIDCIVSDYEMPRMDGLEFLKAVRERDEELPFILFTGRGSEEVASEAIAAGVTDYLQKESGIDQYDVLANRIHNCVEKVRMQRALDHTEEEFRHMVDAVTEYAIFMLDFDGHVKSWNRGAKQIKGYRRDEIVGQHFSVFYPEQDREADYPAQLLEEAVANNHVEDEGWRVRKDGTRFWANVTITALYEDDGSVRGFAKVTRDMTERKRQKEALETEKERFRSMVQEVEDYGIFMLDSEGHVTSWNAGAERIKGYSREDILGKHVSVFYPDEATETGDSSQLLERARADGRVEHEGWRVRKDGSKFWAHVVITALHDGEGDVRGFSKVTRDMTERREYQQRLEHQTEQIEELLRVVAHDLRNPASVARGHLELARESDDWDALETVETAVERMETIIEEILNLSESGVIIRDPSPVDLADTVTQAWEIVETNASTLVVDDLDDVRADDVQLQSIFENLFQNAVVHGGDVTVRVGSSEDGFYVADDGPGIPPENREDVLEYGYSTRESGTGFGLSIVNTIVEAHGWNMTVTESASGGARIEITDVQSVG